MLSETKIINLLKSGNFTIAYHDNGYCIIYKDRLNYEDLPNKGMITIDCENNGYLPKEVELLVKALGGNSCSI